MTLAPRHRADRACPSSWPCRLPPQRILTWFAATGLPCLTRSGWYGSRRRRRGGRRRGGRPFGTGLLLEGRDGGLDRREEVPRVDRAGQLVAFDLGLHRILELGEHQADAG